MNDEFKRCVANRDCLGLLTLASQYEAHNMTQTAKIIRIVVSKLDGARAREA